MANRNITPPQKDQFVEQNGDLTARSFQFLQLVANLDPIYGEGTPEGNVEARRPRLYMDLNGTPGSILYIKQQNSIANDRTRGWVLV